MTRKARASKIEAYIYKKKPIKKQKRFFMGAWVKPKFSTKDKIKESVKNEGRLFCYANISGGVCIREN